MAARNALGSFDDCGGDRTTNILHRQKTGKTSIHFIFRFPQRFSDEAGAHTMENEASNEPPIPCKISPKSIFESLSGRRIEPRRFTIPECSEVRQGASADVQLAVLHPSMPIVWSYDRQTRHFVALKRFRLDEDSCDGAGLVPLAHELSLLSTLAHKNIVKLVGFAENAAEGVAWLVLPWAANGNLREFVRSEPWDLPERASLMGDVVCGVEYLHSRPRPICHGDLKSLNILVSESCHAVITDFGSARVENSATPVPRGTNSTGIANQLVGGLRVEFSTSSKSITLTGPAWTIRWAAPELLRGESPSLASDIWALGWICWEVLTGDFPFDGVTQETHVILRIIEGNIPSIVEKHDLSQVNLLFELIESCWSMDPRRRAYATDCRSFMARMNMIVPSDTLINGERLPSVELLQALSQTHFAEGRVGEGIRYLLKSSSVAQVAGRHYAGVEYRRQLYKYKRSISRIETVHEEEAVGAWNMALELAATQLDRQAESHLLHAALRYRELGFQRQVLECEQFMAGLQEVVRYRPPSPLSKPAQAVDGGSLGKRMQPIPPITHAIYSRKGGPSNIVWFIAGALQRASPDSLNPREIFSLIQKYQLWKFVSGVVLKGQQDIIDLIKTQLSEHPAFHYDKELPGDSEGGRWHLTRPDLLPPDGLLPAYDLPLSNPGEETPPRTSSSPAWRRFPRDRADRPGNQTDPDDRQPAAVVNLPVQQPEMGLMRNILSSIYSLVRKNL